MEWTSDRLRTTYLEFFQKRGHVIIPSAPLVPENDPSTLFTGSGMQPIVPYLLGEPHPQGTRLVNSQKCFRTQDIDEVGDNRHTTFFEMLGNWSLGDYFKREQIGWMYEFLTKEIGLDPARIFVSVFRGSASLGISRDDEAVGFWQEQFLKDGIDAKAVDFSERDGMQGGHIFFYDERKNWWSRSGVPSSMPVGEPGGPDSEIFWDFGSARGLHEFSPFKNEPCHINCDCGRFLEIGNNVFMQLQKTGTGFGPLPKRNVDFGGGLERSVAAVADEPDIFRIDLFDRARSEVERLSGIVYGTDEGTIKAFRVILDHLRAAVMLIGDGILPSNKDQGYFVRRLIRRAVRFGKILGIKDAFSATVADAFVATYMGAYSNLRERAAIIHAEILREEEKFRITLTKGETEFEKMFSKNGQVSGEDAFVLYATYGFPLELTQEIAGEKGQRVDRERFETEFHKHQDLSRAGSEQKFAGGLADNSDQSIRYHTATHLLHTALREVLGDHIAQKGSNITPERLRFDFSHPQKVTPEELARVSAIVQEKIDANLPVHFNLVSVEEAKAAGSIGLFEDKYAQFADQASASGGKVKMYSIGNPEKGYASREICGGPHVAQTGMIGKFRILKEEAISQGVRRIKAVVEPSSGAVVVAQSENLTV